MRRAHPPEPQFAILAGRLRAVMPRRFRQLGSLYAVLRAPVRDENLEILNHQIPGFLSRALAREL
jgi:hypothetical protein